MEDRVESKIKSLARLLDQFSRLRSDSSVITESNTGVNYKEFFSRCDERLIEVKCLDNLKVKIMEAVKKRKQVRRTRKESFSRKDSFGSHNSLKRNNSVQNGRDHSRAKIETQ